MSDAFDPYQAWLGIGPEARPLDYYRLLGLPPGESDLQRIADAADARMVEVRQHQTGPRGQFTQRLLNELAAARRCLLDPRAKRAYDEGLAHRLAQAMPGELVAAPPLPEPPIGAPPVGAPEPPPSPPAPRLTSRPMEASPAPSGGWWVPVGVLCAALMVVTLSVGGVYLARRPPAVARPPVKAKRPPVSAPSRREPPVDGSVVITQEGSGDLHFPLAIAETSGGVRELERDGAVVLTDWSGDEAVARWRFKTVQPAVFQVEIVYAAQHTGTAEWELAIDDEARSRAITAGDTEDAFYTDQFFWKVSRSGQQVLELRAFGLPDSATLVLKSLRFVKKDVGRVR